MQVYGWTETEHFEKKTNKNDAHKVLYVYLKNAIRFLELLWYVV